MQLKDGDRDSVGTECRANTGSIEEDSEGDFDLRLEVCVGGD